MRNKSKAMKRTFFKSIAAAALLAVVGLISGCVVQEPVPAYAPPPSGFDRSWNAARGAVYDEGLRVVNEDRSRGVITAVRGEQEVTIALRTQADGSVRVEITTRGPQGSDPGLSGRVSRAYDRRMGR